MHRACQRDGPDRCVEHRPCSSGNAGRVIAFSWNLAERPESDIEGPEREALYVRYHRETEAEIQEAPSGVLVHDG